MVFTIGLGDTILQEHIPGASFFIMMIVIIKSSPETIKQISFLLNYEVNNSESAYPMEFLEVYRSDRAIDKELQGKTPQEREAYLKDLLGYQEESAEEKEFREAKAKTPELVNAHIRKLERELFHTWAFIMGEGLCSEALEYVNEHKDEETPFEW